MNVGMQQQVLSPGVQDADEADFGAPVFRIRCDFQQRLRTGSEQQVVKEAWVLQHQDVQLMRYGEDNVEIASIQKFALASLRLTLRAVPVAAANGELPITCLMGSFS
jgi:hypothetical protein